MTYKHPFFNTEQQHAQSLAAAFSEADGATLTPKGKHAKYLAIEDRDVIVKALSALTSRPAPATEVTGERVSHDRALEAAQRLINSHFGNHTQARTRIPATSDDDDLVICRYIKQQRATATPSPDAGRARGSRLRYRIHQMERAVVVRVADDGTGGEIANCLNSFGDQDKNACLIRDALNVYDAGRVPEGWQLVPTKATPRMMAALLAKGTPTWQDGYYAMLDAAPQPNAKEEW